VKQTSQREMVCPRCGKRHRTLKAAQQCLSGRIHDYNYAAIAGWRNRHPQAFAERRKAFEEAKKYLDSLKQ